MAVDGTTFGINISQEFQSGLSFFGGVFPTEQFQEDLDYLWSLGFREARIASQNWQGGAQIDVQKTAALLAKAKGFATHVGLVQKNPHKPSDWPGFQAAIPDFVSWAQANGMDTCMIGNENESYPNISTENYTSLTRTSNVVTVVCSSAHNLQVGDAAEIQNSTTVSTGFYTVTEIVDTTTFKFNSVGANGSDSVGRWRYSSSTVANIIRRLATTLVASYSIPLSYSAMQGIETGSTKYIDRWVANGRGNLTYLDLNIYGTPIDQVARLKDFVDSVNVGYNAFGPDHFRITEWNLYANNSGVPSDTKKATKYFMGRLNFLKTKPGLKHFFFCYRERNNLLVVKKPYNSNGSDSYYRDWWWNLTNQRPKTKEVTTSSVITTAQYRRQNSPMTRVWSGLEMNYGQDTQAGTYNTTQITTDLNKMWNMGIRKLRIAMTDYTATAGVDAGKSLVLAAKTKGFYVVWGVALSGFASATDANWSTYTTAVNDAADWAWANGVDEFMTGNEVEYSETTAGTLTNSVQKIKDLGTDVLTNHFMADGVTRFVSYGVAQSSMDYVGAPGGWIATGKGPYHKLGYNIYGDPAPLATNRAQWEQRVTDFYNAFGSGMYVSEFNIGGGEQFPASSSAQGEEIASRVSFLENLGVSFGFFFTYRWDSGNESNKNYYALANGASFKEWLYYLFRPS